MHRENYVAKSVSNPPLRSVVNVNQPLIEWNNFEAAYSEANNLNWVVRPEKTEPIKLTPSFKPAFYKKMHDMVRVGHVDPIMADLLTYMPDNSIVCRTRIFKLPCIFGNDCRTCRKMVDTVMYVSNYTYIPPQIIEFVNSFLQGYQEFHIGGTATLENDGIRINTRWTFLENDNLKVIDTDYVSPLKSREPVKKCAYFQSGQCRYGNNCKFGHFN